MFLQPIAQKVDPWRVKKIPSLHNTHVPSHTAGVRCNKLTTQISVTLHHFRNGPHGGMASVHPPLGMELIKKAELFSGSSGFSQQRDMMDPELPFPLPLKPTVPF